MEGKSRFWTYIYRSCRPEVFLVKGVLKICCKFTGEDPCQSVISIKLQSNFTKQLYWNHTSAWVFSCKFAAYFQNTFFKEHLWVAASVYIMLQKIQIHNLFITNKFSLLLEALSNCDNFTVITILYNNDVLT